MSKVFVFFTLAICSYILCLNALPVSQIYCLPHLVHSIRYIMLLISQVNKVFLGRLAHLCVEPVW